MTYTERAKALRPYMEKAAISLNDKDALKSIALFPLWASGGDYITDQRIQYAGELYRVIQNHTSQANWIPGEAGTESLYARIDEQHDGTKYDPIPYSGNMALENGKYYSQGGVTYKCIRDTGNPVYHALSELVGLYVEVA